MAEFLELVKGAPNFGAMGQDELVIYVYALFAAGKKVDSENAKLRELVRDMWSSYCYANNGCDAFLTDEQDAAIRERMRKLGVEVNR